MPTRLLPPLCIAAALAAAPAAAATVNFSIDLAGSAVAVTDQSSPNDISEFVCAVTDCVISAALAPGLAGPLSFSLAEGESETFDFAVLTAAGVGVPLDFSLAATLGLVANGEAVSASATGEGSAAFAGGFFLPIPGLNGFAFDGQPIALTLADGSSIEIAFGGYDALDFGREAIVSATVSLIDAVTAIPLPAPAAMLFGALGLLGFVSTRRRLPA